MVDIACISLSKLNSSTGWIIMSFLTDLRVILFVFSVLFRYLTFTVLIFPSLPAKTSTIIPNWYSPEKLPSCFRNNTTSPVLISYSSLNHVGYSIRLGTCVINHASNHAWKIFSFDSRNLSG